MLQETATKSVKVYALQNPNAKIKVQFVHPTSDKTHVEEAAIISYVYTLTDQRRPQPSVEPERTIYRNLRPWKKVAIPNYVVIVEDGITVEGAPVVAWDGKKSLQGDAPWGRPIVGTVASFDPNENVWIASVNPEGMELAETQAAERMRLVETEPTVPVVAEPVPAPVVIETTPEPEPEPIVEMEPDPVVVHGVAVENNHAEYTGDSFTISEDGHYVGDDGWVVPRNFDEFYERYPKYVLNWVKKRLNKFTIDDDVEDWTQDLLIHMKFLPEHSKYRQPGWNGRSHGCTDVIETFNPYQQYGASEKRFRNFINICLANKFNTVQSKRKKNPVCRPGNITFGASPADELEPGIQSDEYIHTNSRLLMSIAERKEKQHDDRLFTNEFKRFVKKEDPSVFPAVEALEATGPLGEAAEYMGITDQEFARYRARLKQLAECFLQNAAVPKQRKPYKKRTTAASQG